MNNPILYADYSGEAPAAPIAIPAIGILLVFGVLLLAIAILWYAGVLDMPGGFDVIGQFLNGTHELQNLLNEAKAALGVFLLKLTLTIALGKQHHHIVARRDIRATFGRYILRISNIGVNSVSNMAWVRTALHQVLHRNEYHAMVTVSVTMAYLIGKRDAVLKVLNVFRNVLSSS